MHRKGAGVRKEDGGCRTPGAGDREMLQGKKQRNVQSREAVLVRGGWERQLFAAVSKDSKALPV